MELESEKGKRKDLEKKVLKEEETQRTLWTMWKEERKKNEMLMKTINQLIKSINHWLALQAQN